MNFSQSFHSETAEPPSYGKPIQFTLITAQSALTATLAALVQAQVSENDALPPAPFEDMTVFHALEPPAISVADYVARVSKYVFCSEACLVAAYHYVNTAVRRDPKLALTSLSVHRMFITAIVLACKYFDDVSYNLMYYSKVGGLPHKELANLEINMLRILDFRLDISAKDFVEIEAQMMNELRALQQGPIDVTSDELVKKATFELDRSRMTPIEFELLSDEEDVDMFYRVSDRSCDSAVQDKLRASPATSAVTDEGSKLSRNSSMSSMEESNYASESVVEKYTVGSTIIPGKHRLAHSPTTPSSKYRVERPIATAC